MGQGRGLLMRRWGVWRRGSHFRSRFRFSGRCRSRRWGFAVYMENFKTVLKKHTASSITGKETFRAI